MEAIYPKSWPLLVEYLIYKPLPVELFQLELFALISTSLEISNCDLGDVVPIPTLPDVSTHSLSTC